MISWWKIEAREAGGPREKRWQNSHLRARLQGGPLRLQKVAGRDCARLRGKLQETKLETAKSEQLRRSEGASLPVPKTSGVFPKDSEAAGPSKGRKAGKSKRKAQKANGSKNPVAENEPDGVYPGAFEGKGKSRLKKKDNSHLSTHHPS